MIMSELLQELQRTIDEGKPVWGGLISIDEERFYVATTKIRKSLPASAQANPDNESRRALDALEWFVEKQGAARLFGKVCIRRSGFAPLLQNLVAAVENENLQDVPQPATPSDIIAAAQQEAQRIIAEAQREAERIHEEARGLHPWSN